MAFGGYLKADTETKVVIGPVVAVGDGFTPVTNLNLGTADEAEILKHNAAAVTDISGYTFAAIGSADGYYNLTIAAGGVDTEGRLTVLINDDSLCLPVRMDFEVVNANVYDSLFAAATTDYLQTDMLQMGGVTQSATDLKDFADTGYNPATHKVAGVVLTDTCTTNTDLVSAANVVDEFETQSQADPTGFHVNVMEVNGTAQTANDNGADINEILTDTGTTLDTLIKDIPTVAEFEARTIPAADYLVASDTLARVTLVDTCTANTDLVSAEDTADAVWDEATSGHTNVGSMGLALGSLYSTLVVRVAQCGDAGSATTIDLDASASAVNDFYKGQLIAIVLGTGAGQARTCTSYAGDTKIATVTPSWATNPDGDSYFAVLNTGSTVVVDWADGGRLDTILDNILTDTNELQTDDIPTTLATIAGYLDTEIAAIVEAVITNAAGADIAADIIALKAETSAIVTDTNELQTDWHDGGRLDLILDIIAADTTTDIPALIATAQADLDTLTGADGATISSASIAAIWDATEAITGQSHSFEYILAWLYRRFFNKQLIIDANGNIAIRNEADGADIATGNVVDNAGTTTMAAFTIA